MNLNISENVSTNPPRRNVFDLSHDVKYSGDMGKLYPILIQEVIPGDTFKCQSDIMMRAMPLVCPPMHRVNTYIHYFFVPTRLVWDDFEKFITGGVDGEDETEAPYRLFVDSPLKSIDDFMRIPSGVTGELKVSILPIRMYNQIYNDWYIDLNIQTPKIVNKGNGNDTTTEADIWSRCWEKDFFSSALLWPQRGPDVTIGIGTTAPVTAAQGVSLDNILDSDPANQLVSIGGGVRTVLMGQSNLGSDENIKANLSTEKIEDLELTADISAATAITINALRNSVQLQAFFEKCARGGSRYVEILKSFFGVTSSDARLSRSEYLGGGKTSLQFSEIPQTSQTGTTPQGTLAGHGFAATRTIGFTKTFEEHGYVIGIQSTMPRTSYSQGLPRDLTRFSRFDYYWPEFAHLGEQPVFGKEIYAVGNTLEDDKVWAYQGRYDEYRRTESRVHADLKDSLNEWHMGRLFDSKPELNSDFVKCDPTKRIFAAPGSDGLVVHVYNDLKAIRPIPTAGIPSL